MSEYGIITDGGRRRRWSSFRKLRIVEETLDETAGIPVVARRHGVTPDLLYRWRRLMLEGGAVAAPPDVSGSNRHARVARSATPRRRHHKAQDAAVVPLITSLVAARPTCGYRRIAAILNRQLRATSASPVNHRRVCRIMQAPNLLLARRHTERPGRA